MIEKKVSDFLGKHGLDLMGKSIAIGISGGPDSLALLHYLWRLRDKYKLKLVAIHVDHMFRGEESYQEALFVQDFCKERSIPFEMTQVNVPEYIERTGKSSQLAARELRYDFFTKVMEKYQSGYLALGHHGDDQIETILMRLTRGGSGKARAGIPFSRPFSKGLIIRPFLCLTKDELEEYCQRYRLEPRRDPSNEKEVYSRNRFRKHVLPFLKGENPLVHEHFQRFSEELAKDEEYLSELTRVEMNKVIKKTEKKVSLDIQSFLAIPMPLQSRGIKLILRYLYKEPPTSLSAIHIESIEQIIRNPHPSGTLDFPNGLKVIRSYGFCHFEIFPTAFQPFKYELHVPGRVRLPDGRQIEADYLLDEAERNQDSTSFLIELEETSFPLIIRTRKAGDRMSLKGMVGTRKLKDIFIDEKIPLAERERWPVITDQNDTILWLPGLKKSNVTIDDGTNLKLVKLKFRQ